nr:RpiB/LacA/LacB family sugar-phosphate isomerase [Paracoccus saliphilus]
MKLAIAGHSAGEGPAEVWAKYLEDQHEMSEISRAEGLEAFRATLSDRIAIDKILGIRASVTHDTSFAKRAALSNNGQIITMGAQVIGTQLAEGIGDEWFFGTMNAGGRFVGNMDAIDAVDGKYGKV